MKTFAIILAAMFLAAGVPALSQTMMIAHRSHGGTVETFSTDGQDNFGLPPRRIDSVMKLTDSTALEYSNQGNDTVLNHHYWNNPRIGVDSLRRLFPGINFIGYEEKKSSTQNGLPKRRGGRRYSLDATAGSESNRGRALLVLLGAIAIPALAYGFWRGEAKRHR
ncbi:MAG TPA: hypothetical protein VHI13_21575 [Candidatus Kapabacteria bacterium]|nr:hypothetical protein [Candidatus Kapabacteria bacterium]